MRIVEKIVHRPIGGDNQQIKLNKRYRNTGKICSSLGLPFLPADMSALRDSLWVLQLCSIAGCCQGGNGILPFCRVETASCRFVKRQDDASTLFCRRDDCNPNREALQSTPEKLCPPPIPKILSNNKQELSTKSPEKGWF